MDPCRCSSASRWAIPPRFVAGTSSTSIPAGGTRLFYQSLEYRWRCAAVFVDAGSVWDPSTESSTRWSTGFGCHGDEFFLTLGVPLNADDVRVTFMTGVRF